MRFLTDRRAKERRVRDRRERPATEIEPGSTRSEPRQQERRTSPAGRRRHRRIAIPFGTGAPAGRLTTADGRSFHAKVWDLSQGGLCVVSPQAFNISLGSPVSVVVQSGAGVETARVAASLAWIHQDRSFGHFAGLQFRDGCRLPNGSFLDRYLLSSSGRQPPMAQAA